MTTTSVTDTLEEVTEVLVGKPYKILLSTDSTCERCGVGTHRGVYEVTGEETPRFHDNTGKVVCLK